MEGRDLADQREQLAAVIEVAAELRGGEGTYRRGRRVGLRRGQPFRILGELMHVDDVRDAPELMQRRERLAALEPGFEGDEEEDRGAEEDHGADGGVHRLDEFREAVDPGGKLHRACDREEHHRHRADGCADPDPPPAGGSGSSRQT